MESTISGLATSEISIFQQVSVAEETGLGLALLQTPKDRFCHVEAHIIVTPLATLFALIKMIFRERNTIFIWKLWPVTPHMCNGIS